MSSIQRSQVQTVPITIGSQFSTTNQLYRPLKQTLQHPESVRQNSEFIPIIAQSSQVSKDYRKLSSIEIQNIERNIYVPDTELVPTNNLDLVRNEKFVAVDAYQKIAGPPLSAEEFQRIQKNGPRTSQVVYQIKQPSVYQEKPVASPPPRETYIIPSYEQYGRSSEQFKYNLFSCIDEPINECRQNGCGKCTRFCAPNEIIASQRHSNYLRSSFS